MSACRMFCFKCLHLRVTLFSQPLIMHPSSEYLIREENIKQPALSPPTRRGASGIEPSWRFHHSRDTRWAWYQTARRCHSRTTALLRKWNKAIKGNNWVVASFLAVRISAQRGCHKSNCQSVEERWIWLHGKDHWLWVCSRRGVSVCVCCWENDGYVHVCLGMEGLLLAMFWRLIYTRAGFCPQLSVFFSATWMASLIFQSFLHKH